MLDAKLCPTPLPSGLKLLGDDGSLLPDPGLIDDLWVASCIWVLLTLISHLLFSSSISSSRRLAPLTGLLLSTFSGTSKGSPLLVSFLILLTLLSYVPTLMRHGHPALTPVVPSLAFVSSLGPLLSLGRQEQVTVSRSSAEAEYHSMASFISELRWISFLLRDLHIPISLLILFCCDNKVTLHITANPVFHECTNHLKIDYHLVRDQFKLGFIAPSHILSSAQMADLFTKPLPVADFARFLPKLGLSSSAPS
ncbi:UNVERIFIED_CONTAM: hypothetical protein Sindi_1326000 [Sesamum indicum]